MVSVIIPVYNVEKYLRKCVDSVLCQTYSDLEIILVDDGSPDRCGEICEEYALKDSRISVIHKKNGGLSDARNAGLKAAAGEYIYFLDSDDYLRNDAIGELIGCIEKEKADMVCFSAKSFSDSGVPVPDDEKMNYSYETASGAEILVKRFENVDWYGAVPLFFYRADFLKREKLHFIKGLLYEDLMFSGTTCLRECRVAALNKQLYYYRRMRSGSIMNKKPVKRNFDSFFVIAKSFIAQKEKTSVGSVREKGFDYLIRYCFNRCVMTYCDMVPSERRKVRGAFGFIRRETDRIRSVDCRKLKLTLKCPGLWFVYYRAIRKPAKYLMQLIKYKPADQCSHNKRKGKGSEKEAR